MSNSSGPPQGPDRSGPPAPAANAGQMGIIDTLARALVADLPAGWREVSATYRSTAPYAELDATVTGPAGQRIQVDPLPANLEDQFEALRDSMYQPGKGAWLTATITITAEGRFTTDYNYDNEPAWTIPVTPDTYIAELDQYPRTDQHIPDWMRHHTDRT